MTRQILRYRLERRPDPGEEAALVQSFLKYGTIYVVADPDTTIEEWTSKTFGIATEEKALRLYIDREDALQYARTIKATLPNGTIMVMKTTQAMAKSLIAEYSHKGIIREVWLCGRTPIRAKVGVVPFTKDVKRDSPSTIMEPDGRGEAKAPTQESSEIPASQSVADTPLSADVQSETAFEPKKFLLVEDVRKVLSEPVAAERRKIDPSGSFLNFHCLMEKLIHTNRIDPSSLDAQFGLVEGFTELLMTDITSCNVPKSAVAQYLRYFGLYEFFYLFKTQSTEIAEMLKGDPQIDPYPIQKWISTSKAEECFTLTNIRTKQFNGINLYRLTFQSKDNRRKNLVYVTSSTNHDMIVGKDYILTGIEPLDNGTASNVSTTNAATSEVSALPSKEEELAKLEEMERAEQEKKKKRYPSQSMPPQRRQGQPGRGDPRMTGKNRYISETPEEKLEKDKQTVLEWIIKTKKVGEKEARRMMVGFDDDAEALASFAKYLNESKADTKFARRGYTPRRLMHDLHYSPIEAYEMMTSLMRDPQNTMQRLKYRETDPQYQPQRKTDTGKE